jgi:hypothetical protein
MAILGQLVDEGCKLKIDIEMKTERLSEIKKKLLQIAERDGTPKMYGKIGQVSIQASSKSSCEVDDLIEMLEKLDKSESLPKLVKVKITNAKKFLGEEIFGEISNTSYTKYGKVAFKPLK